MIYPRENAKVITGDLPQVHLYFDTMTDFPNLPGKGRAAPGSTAYCLATKDVYILNGSGIWEVQ